MFLHAKVHDVQPFAMFILAVRKGFMHEGKDSISEQNARENVRNICDNVTGKHAGPFAGIITEETLKVCQIFVDFSGVKEL